MLGLFGWIPTEQFCECVEEKLGQADGVWNLKSSQKTLKWELEPKQTVVSREKKSIGF